MTLDMSQCGYEEMCRLFGPQLQTLINNGKGCQSITMNILTHDHPKKDPDYPELGYGNCATWDRP